MHLRNLLILGSALGAPFAQASVTFIGDTYLTGTGTDSSGLGAGLLEDGVSPKNGLNGFGSGLAWAGGNLFYALSDRGPNKVVYDTFVDNTTSYPCRFQKFEITFDTTGVSRVGGVFPSFAVTATHKGTVLFKNVKGHNYTGLSTGFATDTNENRRLDPEGLRVASDGSFWISDEYGPWILHFDSLGNQIDTLATPKGFRLAKEDSTLDKEIAENSYGRYTNKGAEGLALTPDGKTLLVMLQSSMIQDSGANGLYNRTLIYDLANPSAAPKQYVYPVDNTSQSVSEVVAVNNHQFLVDERNGKGGKKGIKLLYLIDIAQDTLPTDLATTAYKGDTATDGLPGTHLPSGIVPLKKTLFADIGSLLLKATPWPFTSIDGLDSLPDKIEGYAFGPDLPDGRHLLLATNDNDFVMMGGSAGTGYPDYFFAFAIDDSTLPGLVLPSFENTTATTGIATATAKLEDFRASLRAGELVVRSSVSGRVHMEILDARGRLEKDLGDLDLVSDHTQSLAIGTLPNGLHILRCRGAVTTSQALLRF